MKTFHYQLIRYVHDKVTGEFVNVGIIVFSSEMGYLKTKVTAKVKRISQFYGELNSHYLLKTLKNIQNQCDIFSKESDLLTINSIEQITNKILPKDDSSLYFSEARVTIDLEPAILLNTLFNRFVDRFNKDVSDSQTPDTKAWKSIYKQYFDKYNIANKLTEHVVETSFDEIKFDKAWKNGSWHCYQTLSFDLKSADSIKDKVYKWLGKVNQIQTTNEDLNLYLLTSEPKVHKELNSFVDTILKFDSNQHVKVRIIKEAEAEEFAHQVQKEMEKCNHS